MSQFFSFIASMNGRIARIVVGALVIVLGLFVLNTSSVVQILVILIGLVPLLAGVFDVCLVAPLAKLPFKGADLRKTLGK